MSASAANAAYLYGLTRQVEPALEDALRDLAGATSGAPKACILAGRSVVIGAHDGSEILQTRRRMLAHARVLEAMMGVSPVLPMRFGHVAADVAVIDALLSTHHSEIETQFDRIGHHVEVGLRVRMDRRTALTAMLEEMPSLVAARDRLAGRGAEAHFDRIDLGRRVADALDARRTRAQHGLAAAIAKACEDHVLKAPEDDVELIRAECLVAPDALEALAEIADRAARASGFAPGAEPEVRLIGPVPPFHFIELSLALPEEAVAWV